MLRQTIKEIGTEVSRLVHTLEDQSRGETTGPASANSCAHCKRAQAARHHRTEPRLLSDLRVVGDPAIEPTCAETLCSLRLAV